MLDIHTSRKLQALKAKEQREVKDEPEPVKVIVGKKK